MPMQYEAHVLMKTANTVCMTPGPWEPSARRQVLQLLWVQSGIRIASEFPWEQEGKLFAGCKILMEMKPDRPQAEKLLLLSGELRSAVAQETYDLCSTGACGI